MDFKHCGLGQLPQLCASRAIPKMFPSAFQDVQARMPAVSCAAGRASPGFKDNIQQYTLFLRNTSHHIPQVPRFPPLTFKLGLSGSRTKCNVVQRSGHCQRWTLVVPKMVCGHSRKVPRRLGIFPCLTCNFNIMVCAFALSGSGPLVYGWLQVPAIGTAAPETDIFACLVYFDRN